MRKLVIALAAAGSAIAVATPASAQYFPQSSPYGYGYGYHNRIDTSDLQRRLYNVRRSLVSVRPDRAYRLNAEASALQQQLRFAARSGNPYEVQAISDKVYRLELELGSAVANRGYGYNGYNGYNGYYGNRDRRGGDDRWDRGDDDRDGD